MATDANQAQEFQDAGKSPLVKALRKSRTLQNLLAAVLGGVASLLAAWAFVHLHEIFGVSSLSRTFWSMTPVWAVGSGIATASGYYYGSRLLIRRPTRLLSFSIFSFSVGVFFLHYLGVCFLVGDRHPGPGLLSFCDFLATGFSIAASKLQLWATDVESHLGFGSLGGGYALMQLLGFWCLVASVYFHLRSLPYCDACGRYFIKKGERTRYTSAAREFVGRLELLTDSLLLGDFQGAIAMHASSGSKSHEEAEFSWTMKLRRCPECDKHWLSFTVDKLGVLRWRKKTELEYVTYSPLPIELNPPSAANLELPRAATIRAAA